MISTLTRAEFYEKVYDLTDVNARSLSFKGLLPAVILFGIRGPYMDSMYSDFELVSGGLNGNGISFYFVDANVENGLTEQLGIRVLPTLLFVPLTGDPTILMGLATRDMMDKTLVKLIPRSVILT